MDIDRSDEILDGEFVTLDEPVCAELVDAQTAYGASQIRRGLTGFRTRQTA